jgi:ribosomal protein L31
MTNPNVKKGTCADCIEKQKSIPDYCCLFCSLGLIKEKDSKPGKNGSVVIDLSDPNHPFWTGKPKESARLVE